MAQRREEGTPSVVHDVGLTAFKAVMLVRIQPSAQNNFARGAHSSGGRNVPIL